MRGPSLEEFTAKVESYKPTFVYLAGPYSGLVDSIKGTVGPITLQGACACVSSGGGHSMCVEGVAASALAAPVLCSGSSYAVQAAGDGGGRQWLLSLTLSSL